MNTQSEEDEECVCLLSSPKLKPKIWFKGLIRHIEFFVKMGVGGKFNKSILDECLFTTTKICWYS